MTRILNQSKAGKEAQEFLRKSAEKNVNKFKETEESLKKQDILNGRAGRKLLKHRGPDEEGEWYNIKKGVYFGHTRLSIIDLNFCIR